MLRRSTGYSLVVLLAVCGTQEVAAQMPAAAAPATPGSDGTSPLAPDAPFHKARVSFQDPQGLKLVGFVYKPDGPGPFPAIVWNHGSEEDPGVGPEFNSVAAIFVPAGYVVMAPVREGHGLSQGLYIGDVTKKTRQDKGAAAASQQVVQLMQGPQLDDQLAGLALLKTFPFVDTSRIAVVGCSYGGIQTILGAESNSGYRVAVALSPAAESWAGNRPLRERLVKAIDNIKIPLFIAHPPADVSLDPGKVLGAELQKLGKPYEMKIYPPSGNKELDGHCFGGARGDKIWGADALDFIARYMRQD